MVTLTDTAVFNPDCIAEQKLWAAIGLEMCDESGGIAIFQAAVGGLITEWGHQWAAVLGQITATSKYEVRCQYMKKLTSNKITRSVTFWM